jgi:hypothetical protein
MIAIRNILGILTQGGNDMGWVKVFAAIGMLVKVLFTLCLVVICLVLKGLAKLMKS